MDIATLLITILGACSVALIVIGAVQTARQIGTRVVATSEKSSDAALRLLYISDVSARELTVVTLAGAVVVALLAWLLSESPLVGVICGTTAVFVPGIYLKHLQKLRLAKFEEDLPSAIDQLVSSAKAGLSLAQGMEELAQNSQPPISQEFNRITQDYKLGTDIGEAIRNTRDRLGSPSFNLVSSAFLVSLDKGGNLPEALQRISESLKEVWRLEQKLITASAEGRKSMLVISVVPIFVFLMVLVAQPDLITTLTSSFLGYVVLIGAILLYAIGVVWLRRILGTEI